MGGEKTAGLFYGPKTRFSLSQWVSKFNLIEENVLAAAKAENEEKGYDWGDHDIDDLVEKNFYLYDDKFSKFLRNNNLMIYYLANYDWDSFHIGMEVVDYDKVLKNDLEDVRIFCKKYKLGKPTFFGGIVGEYE
jgi:hypothetical protein